MGGGIFILRGDDDLVEMTQQPYTSEDVLQSLLEKYPSLLAGDQVSPSAPRRWLLVAREASLPSREDGSGRWSVDHLFLDQDGVPTLVEVKRGTDTRIRREVVGQMLDYAANAVVYWPIDRLRAVFETRCQALGHEPERLVAEVVGDGDAIETFWEQAATNLQAGKVRLVFVADAIPPELRRIIEFLNVQMSPAEVIGIEVKQYAGENLKTLVSRVIGQTAEAQQRKRSTSSTPRRTDWSWELYATELGIPEERIRVAKQLFDEVETIIAERELGWYPTFNKGYVAFQRPSGYNVLVVDVMWNHPPRFAIKLPKHPTELGLASPYPGFEEVWQTQGREWGWRIPTLDDVPDLALATDIAARYQPVSGPMLVE